MASIFKRKGDKRWTITWMGHDGNRCEKASGTTDKRLAERIGNDLDDQALERKRGLIDPAAERMAKERSKPLDTHFDDYEVHLDSLERDARHVDGTLGYLRKLATALEWATINDLDAAALTAHLAELSESRGTSARTFNASITAWRAFGRWCHRANRLEVNPLASLRGRNIEGDRRRVRRDVSLEELSRIIEAAARSPSVTVQRQVKGEGKRRLVAVNMHYPDRVWAYRIAAGTGFRAGEVISLTPESFDLDSETPTITVEAGYSKRKRRDVQPIRHDLAELLRPWLQTKADAPGEPVCKLPDGKAGMVLQGDMNAARARWLDESADAAERARRDATDFLRAVDAAGRVVDFHGLRVHYVSRVVEAGANVKQAMDLARHSDPKLTLKTYAKVGINTLGRVLDGMKSAPNPSEVQAQTLKATGTDDARPLVENQCPQKSPQMSRGEGKTSAARRGDDHPGNIRGGDHKGLKLTGLRDSARLGAVTGENAPRRTRTFDPLIKSQLLYQLS